MSPPETTVALQEARAEPAREVQVHTQHQEKLSEYYYCSTVGCGYMGSLEMQVVSAWARQRSEVERDMLQWKPLLGVYTETTTRCPGVTTEQEGCQGRLEAFPQGQNHPGEKTGA